jgi:hypothetical protein
MHKQHGICKKFRYEIEMLSQLLIVFAAGIIYGILEALYINTDIVDLRIFGRWSYYHVGLAALMAIVSFALALSYITRLLHNKKRYILYMCIGTFPLALLVEDATWFVVRWTPITRDEWTMMHPGLGINLGFTWIPLWYIIVITFSIVMLWLGDRAAGNGIDPIMEKMNVQSIDRKK